MGLLIKITSDMKPQDRAKAYVKNGLSVYKLDLNGTYQEILPSLCIYLENTLPTITGLRRNKLETTGQIIEVIEDIRTEEKLSNIL